MPAELTLELVIATALADSINPCVFGVLIFLLAYMLAVFKNKHRMLLAGLVYIAAVYLTYFLLGVGIFTFIRSTGLGVPFYYFAAVIAILAGLVEVKDFFFYGKGFSLQIIPGASQRLKHYTSYLKKMEHTHPMVSLAIAFFLGMFVHS